MAQALKTQTMRSTFTVSMIWSRQLSKSLLGTVGGGVLVLSDYVKLIVGCDSPSVDLEMGVLSGEGAIRQAGRVYVVLVAAA